ncbi:unnamed protein product, partial [Choristocarpus tenellus]
MIAPHVDDFLVAGKIDVLIWRSVHHDLSRTLDKSDDHQSIDENIPYREAVGSLIWASVMTRLGIANAIREVAKYSSNP